MAVKKILAGKAKIPAVRNFFINEAKISPALVHPQVMRTFGVVNTEFPPLIVMGTSSLHLLLQSFTITLHLLHLHLLSVQVGRPRRNSSPFTLLSSLLFPPLPLLTLFRAGQKLPQRSLRKQGHSLHPRRNSSHSSRHREGHELPSHFKHRASRHEFRNFFNLRRRCRESFGLWSRKSHQR